MSDRDDFLARVAEAIRGGGLFEEGDTVLAAVSGGADSVAMAWALREGGLCRLHLAHVHHGLRPEADGDAGFVADLARRWSVPAHVERIDTPALAEQWGCGIEEAARRGRYDALAAMAESAGASAVAVAHHAGDQAETVLHRIVRGTHLRGLAGMPPRRPLTATVALVRPLLWATRERIEAVLSAEGLTWRTDHTNRQTEFTRNFLRHEVFPLLRRVNGRVDEALLRLAAAAADADATLSALAGGLLDRSCRRRTAGEVVLRRAPLAKAPPLLASMAMRAALGMLSAPEQALSQDRYDDLLAVLAGRVPAVDLPGGLRAERKGKDIVLRRTDAPE
ncbi:MAG TPA: tRNA lysidine(34) synthetase TilS [Phycisphaerae bacterium]|nr:tRNA lysidine(34) synthetase TilS [Phycisphaerae bacterium]